MTSAEHDLVLRLQNILGEMEGEFLYLLGDIKTSNLPVTAASSSAISMLDMAALCVAKAAETFRDVEVIALINLHQSAA